ncbi:DUF4012 domain-containing protein [Cryobacterium sp. RTS3]|uniref:DUF4012 domain-containing protein n=1 Tax=Cryobacterium sp. RTS3 TaxID=3048643 RepID=UPI002B221BA7|nr:DUF4012 domain-containing protein [Cryobacterium sp. RTS3]MEA9999652.1 DUF4012 domain-containing protein [Cryobacterium sp. RTS3]
MGVPVLIVIAALAWVGTRAYLAKGELESAIPLAAQIQSDVVAGDAASAATRFDSLASHSSNAADLTSDPIWRAFEVVPVVGANLTAVRELAAAVDDISQNAVGPLTKIAGSVKLTDFKPVDGSINVQPLLDAQPGIAEASAALQDAEHTVQSIDTSGTLAVVSSAADRLSSAVEKAAESVTILDRAVRVVPNMLGAAGPRNYVLLFQNPAELRASGGIPGAVALLHTENGHLSLAQQASSTDFPKYDKPVLDLPMETRGLYGDITGTFIQDVTLTPNFPLSGQIAREMWQRQFGVEADGVISIDPVALSYLLKATGPITLPTGDVLNSENAVKLLLTDVYARYKSSALQDKFFAAAAASVFSGVASGDADPVALIKALGQAGVERRVLVWSSHDDDQSVLAGTTLAGNLPVSDATAKRFGVYLNDATGAKMDTYLDAKLGLGQVTCRQDGRPHYVVTVTLTNTAHADAATSLPEYVTGGGSFGVQPGNVKTIVSVYGAPDMQPLGVVRDGAVIGYHPATDSTYPVSSSTVELAPGASAVLDFGWLGAEKFEGELEAESTPGVNPILVAKTAPTCDSALW